MTRAIDDDMHREVMWLLRAIRHSVIVGRVFLLATIIVCVVLLLGGCSFGWEDGGGMDVQGTVGCPEFSNPCQPDPEVPDANVPADNAR